MTTRILIADDQAVVRNGLRVILSAERDMEVVGEAQDGLEAIALADRRSPDVVVMDIRMPRLDGLQAARKLTERPRPIDVLVITTFNLDEYLFGAMRAGASGFLLKDSPAERIVDAVRAVASGDGLLAPEVTRRLIERFATAEPARLDDPALDELSPRELDVLMGIARGLSNAEIAAELVLEVGTVKGHVTRILAKLDLQSLSLIHI
jgi:DNA-binding NarL/FixJ family response regulator